MHIFKMYRKVCVFFEVAFLHFARYIQYVYIYNVCQMLLMFRVWHFPQQ